ncbi:MAG: hypothetical protein ACLPSL_16405 [Smithella sp.]
MKRLVLFVVALIFAFCVTAMADEPMAPAAGSNMEKAAPAKAEKKKMMKKKKMKKMKKDEKKDMAPAETPAK